MAETGTCRVIRFGTRKFSELCGDYKYLISYHGLGDEDLFEQMTRFMAPRPSFTALQDS